MESELIIYKSSQLASHEGSHHQSHLLMMQSKVPVEGETGGMENVETSIFHP